MVLHRPQKSRNGRAAAGLEWGTEGRSIAPPRSKLFFHLRNANLFFVPKILNPAVERFQSLIGDELVLAQVLIQKTGAGYELRHVLDRNVPRESLRVVPLTDVRRLAQFTAAGEFRPLKSAPNLAQGWLLPIRNGDELEFALNAFYPGALADWHAATGAQPPVTHFRDFVNRQSGMYRIAAKITDGQALEVIGATCTPTACLKHRLWTVAGSIDNPAEKSLIPCLEPCAVLLENARKTARAAQQASAKLGENPACAYPPECA